MFRSTELGWLLWYYDGVKNAHELSQDFLEFRSTTLGGTKRRADMEFSRLPISSEAKGVEVLFSSGVLGFGG